MQFHYSIISSGSFSEETHRLDSVPIHLSLRQECPDLMYILIVLSCGIDSCYKWLWPQLAEFCCFSFAFFLYCVMVHVFFTDFTITVQLWTILWKAHNSAPSNLLHNQTLCLHVKSSATWQLYITYTREKKWLELATKLTANSYAQGQVKLKNTMHPAGTQGRKATCQFLFQCISDAKAHSKVFPALPLCFTGWWKEDPTNLNEILYICQFCARKQQFGGGDFVSVGGD